MSLATSTFEIEAKSTSLSPFRSKLRSLVESAGFDAKTTHDILLCVDEILANVIRHGYGEEAGTDEKKIHVSFSEFADRVEVLIEDQGLCFDPLSIPLPELPPQKPGGLGLYLVRSLSDEVHYEALRPRGNRLRLVKYKKGKERDGKL